MNPTIINGRSVRWREGGRVRQQTFPTAADAVAYRDRLRELSPAAVAGTMGAMFEKYLAHRGLAPGSQVTYRSIWKGLRSIHRTRPASLTSDQVITAVQAQASPKLARSRLKLVGAILEFARDFGAVNRNVARLIRLRKPPARKKRIVSDEEFGRVYAVARTRLKVAMDLGRYAALRADEARHVRWMDIDFTAGTLTIESRADWQTKTGRDRTVPMSDRLAATLRAWQLRNPFAPCVLDRRDRYTGRWHKPAIRKGLAHAIRKASVGGFRFHDLRVTCLSKLANGGLPSVQLKDFAGHTSATTTLTYYTAPDLSMMDKIRKIV